MNQKNHQPSFNGLWISSLTHSALRGLPDKEILGLEDRIELITNVGIVSDLPMFVDADTGGSLDQLKLFCLKVKTQNVLGLVIEDKQFPKNNSFANADQNLQSIEIFSEKIALASSLLRNSNIKVIARLEGFINGISQDENIKRGLAFVEAGANSLLVHSKSSTSHEVFEFCDVWKKRGPAIPLACIPTSYNKTTDTQIFERGYNLVVHANHMLRASITAMSFAAQNILDTGSSSQIEDKIVSLNQIFELTKF